MCCLLDLIILPFRLQFYIRRVSNPGNKAVRTILKSDEKIFSKLKEVSSVNTDENFENLALKTIPVLPYEKKDGSNDDEEEEGEAGFVKVSIPAEDLSRSVIVNCTLTDPRPWLSCRQFLQIPPILTGS